MSDGFLAALHSLLAVAGLTGAADLSTWGPATGALTVAIALIAASVLLITVLTVAHSTPGGGSPPHPRRAIDASSPLAQSDPDAPGHPRPRAPQRAASAA